MRRAPPPRTVAAARVLIAGRRLVGNLDAETELARLALDAPRGALELPRGVRLRLAALATLLRAFAREGDRLWTPEPVDPGRIAPVPGLPVPELESGPLERLEPAASILAWAETPPVARHRAERPDAGPDPGEVGHPDPATVARVHDRRFHLEVARELRCVLPGAREIGSLEDLHQHLHAGGCAASPTGRFVLKPPWSAAGRGQVRGSAGRFDRPEDRRRVARQLGLYGRLLFEPWMDRVRDLGFAGCITRGEVRVLGVHASAVDPCGRFEGIDAPLDPGRGDAAALVAVGRCVGSRLARAGYRGPFGVDAFLHRLGEREVLHPLGEINARLTFGHVAHALVERLGPLRLRLGSSAEAGRPAAAIVLLSPGPPDGAGAWALPPDRAGGAGGGSRGQPRGEC